MGHSRYARRVAAALAAAALLLLLGAPLAGGCRYRHDPVKHPGAPQIAGMPDELKAAERSFELRRWSEARDRYLLFLAQNPESSWNAQAVCRIGQCYLAESALIQAEQQFKTCLERFEPPATVQGWAHLGLGDVQFRRGRYREAYSEYRPLWDAKLVKPVYDLPEDHLLFHLGQSAWQLDAPQTADYCWDLLLERHPESPFSATAAELHRPNWIAHAGEFTDHDQAVDQLRRVRAAHFSAELVPVIRNGVYWYRVRVGFYRTRRDAARVVAQLEALQIHGDVLREVY